MPYVTQIKPPRRRSSGSDFTKLYMMSTCVRLKQQAKLDIPKPQQTTARTQE